MTISKPRSEMEAAHHDANATVRVSARDLRETTWRALVAAGVSAGEAQVAAGAVAFGEIHLGCGVDSALRELEHDLKAPSAVGITGDDVRVIEDGAGRGLLLLAPLAVGMIAARPASAPILLPGLAWDPVLTGFFIKHCGDGAPSFFAFEHRSASLLHGCRVDSDIALTVYDGEQLREISNLNPRLLSALTGAPDGLVIVSDFGGFRGVDARATCSPADQQARQEHVFGHGLQINRQLWTALGDASKRYLAVEA